MSARRIGVVVPARDEAGSLPACVRAIATAAAHAPVATTLVVVLDRCTDDSARLLGHMTVGPAVDLVVIEPAVQSVGEARAAGVQALLDRHTAAGLWLATTDADSVVPAHWLVRQWELACGGARVVAGTVGVTDWTERSQDVRAAAERAYAVPLAADGHGHVHGANLGLDAETYVRLGGFAARAHDEDVALVAAAIATGVRVTWAPDIEVTTSARLTARAPLGFAHHLDELAALRPAS